VSLHLLPINIPLHLHSLKRYLTLSTCRPIESKDHCFMGFKGPWSLAWLAKNILPSLNFSLDDRHSMIMHVMRWLLRLHCGGLYITCSLSSRTCKPVSGPSTSTLTPVLAPRYIGNMGLALRRQPITSRCFAFVAGTLGNHYPTLIACN
jgi:hypothetical protein